MALFPDSSAGGRAQYKPAKPVVSPSVSDENVYDVIAQAIKRQLTVEAMGPFAKVGNVQNDLEKAAMPKPADIGDPDRYNEDGSPKYK